MRTFTKASPFKADEAVESDTPARAATSFSVGAFISTHSSSKRFELQGLGEPFGKIILVSLQHIMKTPLLPLILATIGLTAAAHAQVLVSWNFDTNLTPTIVATSSVASASHATLSVGISGGRQNNASAVNVGPSAGNGTWSTGNLSVVSPYALGDADAVNGGSGFLNTSNYTTSPGAAKYVGFTVTMNSTIDPSLSSLEGIQFNMSNAGSSGPRGVEVTYRIGTGSFTSIGGSAVPTLATNQYGLFTFNLPTPVALSGGDVIEFRLLGYANLAGNSVRLDNVRITAVPEPSTALMLGAAGLVGGAWVAARRRRMVRL
ncbi:MAG: hypothetical protein Fur0032_05690 [Terrimicrobiaceae bacterium]